MLYLTGSLAALFAAMAFGLVVYGCVVAVSVARGVWFAAPTRRRRKDAEYRVSEAMASS